ncbi:hypothetical protein DXG01_011986 [Tephrocybe rancida]|nr:hypothetical protein DXG01_011986 [Tephrocybe rancida]
MRPVTVILVSLLYIASLCTLALPTGRSVASYDAQRSVVARAKMNDPASIQHGGAGESCIKVAPGSVITKSGADCATMGGVGFMRHSDKACLRIDEAKSVQEVGYCWLKGKGNNQAAPATGAKLKARIVKSVDGLPMPPKPDTTTLSAQPGVVRPTPKPHPAMPHLADAAAKHKGIPAGVRYIQPPEATATPLP